MSIQNVILAMDEMTALYDSLLDISEQKKQAIIGNKVEELSRLTNRESKIMKQIALLDQQREEAVVVFLTGKGYRSNPSITVSDLIKMLFKAGEKKLLAEAQHNLYQIVHLLKESNHLNQQLLEQSLIYINYSLDLIVGPPDDSIYQNPTHQQQASLRNGIFDSRA